MFRRGKKYEARRFYSAKCPGAPEAEALKSPFYFLFFPPERQDAFLERYQLMPMLWCSPDLTQLHLW